MGDKGDKNAARPPEGSLVETRCLIKGPKSAIVLFPGPRSGPKSRTGPGAQDLAPLKQKNLILDVRKFLRPHNPNIWPFTPLDFYMLGVTERKTIKTPCNNKSELKARRKVSERLTGDSEVTWRPRLKPMTISLNKFEWYFHTILQIYLIKLNTSVIFLFS